MFNTKEIQGLREEIRELAKDFYLGQPKVLAIANDGEVFGRKDDRCLPFNKQIELIKDFLGIEFARRKEPVKPEDITVTKWVAQKIKKHGTR